MMVLFKKKNNVYLSYNVIISNKIFETRKLNKKFAFIFGGWWKILIKLKMKKLLLNEFDELLQLMQHLYSLYTKSSNYSK